MKAIAPNGLEIIGTDDMVPGTALIQGSSWYRAEDGEIGFEWAGETDICWDAQETKRDERGVLLYVDSDYNIWPEDKLTLVEDEDEKGDETCRPTSST